jgi:AcrR family transcriptional regulator
MNKMLDKTLIVFRERRFNAISIDDLSATVVLAMESIYKAFRDKFADFTATFDRCLILRNKQLRQQPEKLDFRDHRGQGNG